MQRSRFGAEAAFVPGSPLLVGATIAPLTGSAVDGSTTQAVIFRLSPGGAIRRHVASAPQILAVLEGEGEVSGQDGVFESVSVGDFVFWASGEQHETQTKTGMTVLVLEADRLLPRPRVTDQS